MAQHVAKVVDIFPWYFRPRHFHIRGHVPRRLGDDQKRVLNSTFMAQSAAKDSAVALMVNVRMPAISPEYRSTRCEPGVLPSKNLDSLALDVRAEQRVEAFARSVVDVLADGSLQCLVRVHKGQKPKVAIGRRIDEDIDIGIGSRFIAGVRAEQMKRRHAETAQGGLSLFQSRNHVIAPHAFSIGEIAAIANWSAQRGNFGDSAGNSRHGSCISTGAAGTATAHLKLSERP
jgi:hypothetical protein